MAKIAHTPDHTLGVETYVMSCCSSYTAAQQRQDQDEVFALVDLATDFLNEDTDGTTLYARCNGHKWAGQYPMADWLAAWRAARG